MPSNDNRDMLQGIATRMSAPPKAGKMGGKRVTHVQRVWTKDDNFDEIECHLTPEEVERLSEPDPTTGLPVLVGDWTGRATRKTVTDPDTGEEVHGPVIPAEYTPPDEEGKPKRGRRTHKKADEE